MRQQFVFRNLEPTAPMKELVDRLTRHVARLVAAFPQEVLFLHGSMERHPSRPLYRVKLSLRLPGRTLATHEESADWEPALREAFRELEREIEREKSRRRAEQYWKREGRREEERLRHRLVGAAADEETVDARYAVLLPHIARVRNYIRRAVAFQLAAGEIFPGEIEPDDVVDTAVLEAVRRFEERPEDLPIDRWLLMLAVEIWQKELERVREDHERAVHVEEDIPETPPEEAVSTLGAEVLDFYQPDEDLRMEDILPDLVAITPEEAAEATELQQCLVEALAAMPERWREAFFLCQVEGLPLDVAARVASREEKDLAECWQRAKEFIQEKLVQRGASPLPLR